MFIKRGKMILYSAILAVVLMISILAIYFLGQANLRKVELAKTIRTHPDSTALVAYNFDEHGEMIDDGQALFYSADNPLVMASTMKVVVLAAYESAVVQGVLNPVEQVPVSDLEKYFLPKTDGGAHAQGLAHFGITVDSLGFAKDPAARISLDDIALIMIYYSGNAETDYLMGRLGSERVNSIPGMEHHTPITPVLGMTLALLNHESPLSDKVERLALINNIKQGDFSYFEHLIDLYLHDSSWRESQIAFMQSEEFSNAVIQIGWTGQVEASQLFPKGTAREYARMMAKIASQQFISSEVSQLMQEKLDSVPSEWPLRLLYFRKFGAKSGVTAGVLNLASYAFPKDDPQKSHGRVVVILTNELPYDTWSKQFQYEGVYLLQTGISRTSKAFLKWANSQ